MSAEFRGRITTKEQLQTTKSKEISTEKFLAKAQKAAQIWDNATDEILTNIRVVKQFMPGIPDDKAAWIVGGICVALDVEDKLKQSRLQNGFG